PASEGQQGRTRAALATGTKVDLSEVAITLDYHHQAGGKAGNSCLTIVRFVRRPQSLAQTQPGCSPFPSSSDDGEESPHGEPPAKEQATEYDDERPPGRGTRCHELPERTKSKEGP